jgi:phosphohistidine phosphatase
MKTLLLMRHAKSSWKDSDLADHERPLNKRGRSDAPRMGQVLCDRELVPQRILCSSALRARQTAEAVANTTGFQGEVSYLDRLYLAEADEYIAALRELPDTIERVLIIGHNPGLETVLQMLSGRIESLPTAVIAYLVLPVRQWSEVSPETDGELIEIWSPKELIEGAEEEQPEKEKTGKKDKAGEKKKDKEKSKKKGK